MEGGDRQGRLLILTSSDFARLVLRSAWICWVSLTSTILRPIHLTHPPHEGSSKNLILLLKVIHVYTQLFTIMCKRKWKNGKFWQLFHDDGKEQRQGKSVTPSAAVWLRQNQQKACFPSISPVFVHFNFSINCPLCKEVGCSRGKSAGNLHRRAIESSRWVPIFNTVQCCRMAWKPQIDTDINRIYSNISIKYTQISIESRKWLCCIMNKRKSFWVKKETLQELRMLSSVTIYCQVTKIVINPGSQLSVL